MQINIALGNQKANVHTVFADQHRIRQSKGFTYCVCRTIWEFVIKRLHILCLQNNIGICDQKPHILFVEQYMIRWIKSLTYWVCRTSLPLPSQWRPATLDLQQSLTSSYQSILWFYTPFLPSLLFKTLSSFYIVANHLLLKYGFQKDLTFLLYVSKLFIEPSPHLVIIFSFLVCLIILYLLCCLSSLNIYMSSTLTLPSFLQPHPII